MKVDDSEYKRRLEKLSRQVLGALQVFPDEFSYARSKFVDDLKEIVGDKFCLKCFSKFTEKHQKCYCDPIYDE